MDRSHAVLLVLTLALVGTARADGWRHVVPKAGDPFAHPPLRAVALSATKPAGLKETARYRGTKQRYARLTYGSGRTAPVTLVVDEVAPGAVDLYIDGDRDNEVTAKERVPGEKLTWRAELKANVHVGENVKELPRTLQVRYNRISRTLAVGTCGYVEGKATLNGKAVTVRRTDGDANGLFADPQDRVWIDADGDGEWDSASEEFLFAPILRLGKERLAVRADAMGQRLELARLEGTGTLKLALPAAIKPKAVREVAVTFQSKDGTVATVRQADGQVTVPAGDYRISSLLLTLDDPDGGAAWNYVFGDNGGKAHRWHAVAKDATVSLDPIGKLDFTVETEKTCKAGTRMQVRPALYTGDGLLIERAYRGVDDRSDPYSCSGKVTLMDSTGNTLESARSGFA
jgi:hypothetical protein